MRLAHRLSVLVPLTLAGLTTAPELLAQQIAAGPSVDVHGFVSQGFIWTTENNYLGPSERGSFELTEAALNFTHSPLDELRIGVQLFVHDLGPFGNYQPQFDWYYLDYRFFDWLGVRAGRTKIPFGLYNELSDVDAARVPVLLPQSVYPVSNREWLLAQTGVELYGDVALGAAGSLSYRVYGGTIYLDPTNVSSAVLGFTVPYVIGARLMWQTPVDGLVLGGSVQTLRPEVEFVPNAEQIAAYTASMLLPPDFAGTVTARIPVKLAMASVEYQQGELLLASEYLRQYLDLESSLVQPTQHYVADGLYALAAYRLTSWLWPSFYYAVVRSDPPPQEGSVTYHHDVALTLRHDINAHWLLKLEGHYMHGRQGLSSDLNGGTPVAELEDDWGVLLLKTTAYF
jgi:hypothetical protein